MLVFQDSSSAVEQLWTKKMRSLLTMLGMIIGVSRTIGVALIFGAFSNYLNLFLFFFQAEDGIRDHCVTGVQTCALPIFNAPPRAARGALSGALSGRARGGALSGATGGALSGALSRASGGALGCASGGALSRSEERRVGKECGWRGAACE